MDAVVLLMVQRELQGLVVVSERDPGASGC